MINLYVDGGSKNNGLENQDATCCLVHEDTVVGTYPLGSMTNNEAEFAALKKAYEYVTAQGFTESVIIWSDSRLVVNISNHSWHAQDPRMVAIAQELFSIEPPNTTVLWLPREKNKAGHVLEFGSIQEIAHD